MVESRVEVEGRGEAEGQIAEGQVHAEFRREAMTLTFWYEGQLNTWSRANTLETIGGRRVAAWVSLRRHGQGGPDIFVKVAVRDGSPEVVELSFISQPGQSEVRQKHLKAVDLEALATELYGFEVLEWDDHRVPLSEHAERIANKFIERQRLPRDYRVIADDFLKQVANVYRENIRRAPTKAVAKHFGVKDRMASTYVDRARKKGYLPPTKQGQKKA
jgi:hypothetical protein